MVHPLFFLLCSTVSALPLISRDPQKSSAHISQLRRVPRSQLSRRDGSLTNINSGTRFLTDITLGSQSFPVIIDTGSSDTWIAATGFTCVGNGCAFASTYNADSSFSEISPTQNLNITYADGTYLNGVMGYESVTIAGLTIPSQEIALVTEADFEADSGALSGLVGLSFNSLTSAYTGSDPTADSASNSAQYSSLMNTIVTQSLADPYFALAVSRDASGTGAGGVLSIGDLPDLTDPTINATSDYAVAPFASSQGYFISVDYIQYGSSSGTDAGVSYLIDSGTSLVYVPTADAVAFNSLFSPAATPDSSGTYYVDCSATAPEFSVVIGGYLFPLNPVDLLVPIGNGNCMSGIQDAGTGSNILGDVFFKNVVAIFDWGNGQMEFYGRVEYES